MKLSSVDYHYAPWIELLVLCSLVWPFLVLRVLQPRGRSAGPVAAVLVPLALFTGGLWNGLTYVRGMPIDSNRRLRASMAAVFAHSFGLLYTGALFAVLVVIFVAVRRHRAFVDWVTATIFAVLIGEIATACYVVAHLDPALWRYSLVLGAAILALVLAVIAMVWTLLTARGRVTSTAIPYGITMMLAVAAIVGVMVWQTYQRYHGIDMNG